MSNFRFWLGIALPVWVLVGTFAIINLFPLAVLLLDILHNR